MKTYFTITAGRTGSAWLTEFLSRNLNIDAVHEPLGIDDFGTRMPDIRTMRSFNNYGNNDYVKAFWRNKLSGLTGDVYAETNHTLAKCGLVENLAESELAKDATLIVLKRNTIKQCVSYFVRNDFINITLAWQWYLHPSYTRNIINPQPFLKIGGLGTPIWYSYEMAARQEYYRQKYGDRINMIEVTLDEAVKEDGAATFLKALGYDQAPILPPPTNENKIDPPPGLTEKVTQIVNGITFDMETLVRGAIERGFTFDEKVGP